MSNDRPENPTVKLNKARLSFLRLFTPKQPKEGSKSKPKYECTFLLHKQHNAADIEAMRAAINKVYADNKDGFFKGRKPKHICMRDGSEKDHLDGYGATIMFVAARTHKKPRVVDRHKIDMVETDPRLFAGCYGNGIVEVYPFVHPESGPMVCASLQIVQYVEKGEPFGEKPADVNKHLDDLGDDDSQVDGGGTSSSKGDDLI